MDAVVLAPFTSRQPGRSLSSGSAINPSTGSMQVNVNDVSYYTSSIPILNWWLTNSAVNVLSQNVSATYSGGDITVVCGCNPNVAVGGTFTLAGMTPSAYNGTYTAIAGTSGSTLVAASANNGAITAQGQIELSQAAAWNATGTASPGGSASYFNPVTGEINNPAPSDLVSVERLFFTNPPAFLYAGMTGSLAWWMGQVWYVTWTGQSVPTLFNGGVGVTFVICTENNQFPGAIANQSAILTFGNVLNVGNTELTFPVPNANNPPANVKVYQAQYNANVQAGQFFNPDWLAVHGQFGTIRTMGWTGGSGEYQTDISQFADANYAGMAGAFAQGFTSAAIVAAFPATPPTPGTNSNSGPKGSVHPSIACAIANATGANPWYNVPIAINDASMRAIAAYFAANLNSNLIVTFQFGNENWNFLVPGPFAYCNAQQYPPVTGAAISSIVWNSAGANGVTVTTAVPHGMPMGQGAAVVLLIAGASPSGFNGTYSCSVTGPSTFTYTLATNPGSSSSTGTWSGTTAAAFPWSGLRSAQLWRIAYDVFGPAQRSRWRGCVDGQMANIAVAEGNLAGIQYYLNTQAPSYITEISQIFDQIVVAGYFGGGVTSSSTITGISFGATTTVTALNSYKAGTCTVGSIAGSVLTVDSSATGTFQAGQVVNNSTTFITAQASGTAGKAGTYNLSSSALNGASGTITAGNVVRLFFSNTAAGTIGALLFNEDVVVASATSSSWTFTNYGGNSGSGAINTTGLTWSHVVTTASCTAGTIANGVLTVAGTVTGTFLVGMYLNTANANQGDNPGPTITAQLTGTTGGAGTYQLFSPAGIPNISSGATISATPSSDYSFDGLLMDLMDDSLANFQSSPATYPTQYTYFAEQMFQATYTGLASNGYNQLTGNWFNQYYAPHALLALSVGLVARQYEGGLSDITSNATLPNSNIQILCYAYSYKYDVPASTMGQYTIAGCYALNTSYWNAAYMGDQSQFGFAYEPSSWGVLRSIPGDETNNPLYSAIVATNQLPNFVDPTPPATGTFAYVTTNYFNASGLVQTFSPGITAACKLIVGVTCQNASISSTAVVFDPSGANITLNQDVNNSGYSAIFSGDIPAGVGTRNIQITYQTGAAFNSRSAFVYTATGLTNDAVVSTAVGSTNPTPISINKGAFVVLVTRANSFTSASVFGGFSSTFGIQPDGGPYFSTADGASAYFVPTFSSPIYGITWVNAGAGLYNAVAAYS